MARNGEESSNLFVVLKLQAILCEGTRLDDWCCHCFWLLLLRFPAQEEGCSLFQRFSYVLMHVYTVTPGQIT